MCFFKNLTFDFVGVTPVVLTLPLPVPSPDEKRGGLGEGLATLPRKIQMATAEDV